MGEFARLVRRQAAWTLREVFCREPLPEEHPVVELVGLLLGDGTGEVQPPPSVPISTQQWLDWYYLSLMNPQELVAAMDFILETEHRKLPQDREAMEIWAASLLLSTLAQLEMM